MQALKALWESVDLAGRLRGNRRKTPFIMQMEAVECGAAALAMILGYYGRFVQLAQLRIECGVSRDGSKASNILKAARRHGLKAKGYSKGLETIKTVPLPCIVFWQFNHFVVVEGFSDRWVYLNDPAVGHRQLTWGEFGEGFTGVVLCFEPEPEFVKEGSLPNPFPALWNRTKGSRKALYFVTLCGLLGVIPGIASAAFTRIVIDSVILEMRFDWLRPLLVAMTGVMLFQLCLTALSGLFFRRMQKGMAARLQAKFYRHILRLPYQYYCQRYVGEVVDRAGINEMIVGLLAGQLTSAAVGMVSMVFFGLVLFGYSVELTMVGLVSTLANFGLMQLVASRRLEANLRIAKQSGKVQAVTIAGIMSIDSLKASGLENSFYEIWAGSFAAASNSRTQLAVENRWFGVLPLLLSSFVSTVTLLLGGFRVMNGEMTLGTLMAFNALMGMFLAPVSQLLGLATQLQQIRGAVVRLEDVMGYPEHSGLGEVRLPDLEPSEDQGAKGVRLEGDVECRGITYGYSPLGQPLVTGFDLKIAPGERVALVGGSGSGKSTVARIVAGLIEPWSGQVLLDGHPREEIPRGLVVHSCSMIEQDFMLFPGTVRDNLTLWDETIPEDWLVRACADAAILEDIMALPGGLDADLLERGANLSGGQRQRLEIARALVRNPTFLVLDEATSALDAATEAVLMENIRRRGCSCLIVAHRLSTIRDCQQILVLRKGEVVETGTHRELWDKKGTYARLVAQG